MIERNFAVTVGSDNQSLKCIDALTGIIHNTYRFVGTIVSGPVVTGDRVTFVVKKGPTSTGYVLRLPSLLVTSTFQA